jgi:hypothetical protein
MEENNKGEFTVAGIWPKLFGTSINLVLIDTEQVLFSFEIQLKKFLSCNNVVNRRD